MSHSDRVAASLLRQLPPDLGAIAMRHRDHTVVAAEPEEVFVAPGAEGLAGLDRLTPGFWAGFLAFELGHAVERVTSPLTAGHAMGGASREAAAVPDVVFARFDARALISSDGRVAVEGDGRGRSALELAANRVASLGDPAGLQAPDFEPLHVAAGDPAQWHSSLTRDAYEARACKVLALLAAGECYQVNLTRRLTNDRALDPVALYAALAARHPAPHLSFLRLGIAGRQLAVVSASPERFLRRDRASVETRPIKGTAASAARLRASAKDHAENVMIVDLARNDLGRVCTPGSIRVPGLCAVEAHPGLHHLVSTVRGTLRPEVALSDLVRATFPPASVTGAPKPRVLQVIEDVEPVRRGVYCGALGWLDTANDTADLSVAIRTFTILGTGSGGFTHFGVGGAIVADSRPDAEWHETELKSARLLAIAGGDAHAVIEDALVAT
ncbi:MAG: anthranilate synthase component I family protein [Acidimicrobiia bacterium]